jgi:hypothetical protein
MWHSALPGIETAVMFAAPPPDDSSLPSVLSAGALLGVLVGYGLGYVHAVWRRARTDYVKTKTAVSGMRSAKWVAWRSMVQRGALVLSILVVLVVWLVVASLDQPGQ